MRLVLFLESVQPAGLRFIRNAHIQVMTSTHLQSRAIHQIAPDTWVNLEGGRLTDASGNVFGDFWNTLRGRMPPS